MAEVLVVVPLNNQALVKTAHYCATHGAAIAEATRQVATRAMTFTLAPRGAMTRYHLPDGHVELHVWTQRFHAVCEHADCLFRDGPAKKAAHEAA